MKAKMIGDSLREARLAKQLQLTDIEQKTGIAVQHLLALELDQFNVIPKEQVEAFLMRYAEAVNLDVNDLLARYTSQSSFQNSLPHFSTSEKPSVHFVSDGSKNEDSQQSPRAHRRRRSHREATPKKSVFPIIVLSFLSLAIITFVGYVVVRQWPLINTTQEEETTVTTTETTAVTETTAATEVVQPIVPLLQEDGSFLARVITEKETVDITFTVTDGESWIGFNDGLNDQQGLTLTPDQETFTSSVNKGSSSYVTLGIPQVVTATIDGQEIDLTALVNHSPATFTVVVE